MSNLAISVEEFKRKYEIGEDVPTDLTALFGKLDISVLPDVFAAEPDNYVLCKFSTNGDGRHTIRYKEELLTMTGFPERVISVQALSHSINSGKTDFAITSKTELSEQDKLLVYELMMPRQLVEEVLCKLESPTVPMLSKIFRVPQEFVRKRLNAMGIEKQIIGYN